MKKRQAFLMIMLLAAGRGLAQETPGHLPESKPLSVTSAVHWFAPAPKAEPKLDLRPVEGFSPRAWATTAGWNPGRSAFPDLDGRNYSWQLELVSAGHKTWQPAKGPVLEP